MLLVISIRKFMGIPSFDSRFEAQKYAGFRHGWHVVLHRVLHQTKKTFSFACQGGGGGATRVAQSLLGLHHTSRKKAESVGNPEFLYLRDL